MIITTMKINHIIIASALVLILGCQKEKIDEVKNDPPAPVAKEQIIELSTDFGNIYIWLYKQTPLHRANFLKLAGEGFYDSTTFHRIVPGFVIQGGDPNSKDNDPNNDGQGGPGYTIPAEFVDSLRNIRGAVATARLGNTVNPTKASSGSQFYINLIHNTSLNGEYTVFGYVMQGMSVADQIVSQPRNSSNNRPITDIRMRVRILNKTVAEIKDEYGYDVPQ
jgi:cyclophilin family peptidyl-prolyl cis-trans isomerase